MPNASPRSGGLAGHNQTLLEIRRRLVIRVSNDGQWPSSRRPILVVGGRTAVARVLKRGVAKSSHRHRRLRPNSRLTLTTLQSLGGLVWLGGAVVRAKRLATGDRGFNPSRCTVECDSNITININIIIILQTSYP